MAYNPEAAERVRAALSGVANVSEIKMMGALVFTLRGHMCCGVTSDSLMVRVGPHAYEATLGKPHAEPLAIGGGRQPRGFVCINPKGYSNSRSLMVWVKRGIDFVNTLPAKRSKKTKISKRKKKTAKKATKKTTSKTIGKSAGKSTGKVKKTR